MKSRRGVAAEAPSGERCTAPRPSAPGKAEPLRYNTCDAGVQRYGGILRLVQQGGIRQAARPAQPHAAQLAGRACLARRCRRHREWRRPDTPDSRHGSLACARHRGTVCTVRQRPAACVSHLAGGGRVHGGGARDGAPPHQVAVGQAAQAGAVHVPVLHPLGACRGGRGEGAAPSWHDAERMAWWAALGSCGELAGGHRLAGGLEWSVNGCVPQPASWGTRRLPEAAVQPCRGSHLGRTGCKGNGPPPRLRGSGGTSPPSGSQQTRRPRRSLQARGGGGVWHPPAGGGGRRQQACVGHVQRQQTQGNPDTDPSRRSTRAQCPPAAPAERRADPCGAAAPAARLPRRPAPPATCGPAGGTAGVGRPMGGAGLRPRNARPRRASGLHSHAAHRAAELG